jgi:hypothetical protein
MGGHPSEYEVSPVTPHPIVLRRLPKMPSRRSRRLLGLPLALAVGLGACGEGEQRAVTEEQEGQLAAQIPTAQAGGAEPGAQDLLVPPPDHARFHAELSASARDQLEVFGGFDRRRMGTAGTWEGRDPQVHIYTTDRPFEEVHAYYLDAAHRLGEHGDGEIEEESMDRTHPDQVQEAAEQLGLPEWYVEGYRELYPQLRGKTGRSAEFSIGDRPGEAADRYREVEITLTQPYPDLRARRLHEETVIQYVVVTMVRTDSR